MDMLHIADLNQVWVEAAVYESEIPLLVPGQKAELELDYLPGENLEGEVAFIYPYLDKKAQANNVRLIFDNRAGTLKPDMSATVRIFAPAIEEALAVPSEAVLHSGTRDIVFVARGDGTFDPREVKAGIESDDGFVQIVSGLFDGERVVVSGQFLLDSESRTREAIAKMRAASKNKMEMTEQPPGAHEHDPAADMPPPPEKAGHVHDEMKTGIDISRLYTCPMHPEFLTTEPKASCPECGMALVPAKELDDKIDLDRAEFYTCPMHPEFLTTDPEGRCPECGMKLEKVKKQ